MLNSDQLEAFEAVARLGSFSLAARELHLSQPALSRRVQGLERELSMSLFTRTKEGAEPTEAGLRLICFMKERKALEEDLHSDFRKDNLTGLSGRVRIAGYSSLLHHVVAPSLAPLMRANPRVQLHFIATQSIRPLPRQLALLHRAETDFLVSTIEKGGPDIEAEDLGRQELVVVESSRYEQRLDTFLDARPEDDSTELYFKEQQSKKIPYERSHLYDEEGILNGVSLGLGRALVFRSMLSKYPTVRLVKGWKPICWTLYLLYRKQAFYSRLFLETRKRLKTMLADD